MLTFYALLITAGITVFISIGIDLILSYRLFNKLKAKYPKYYKSIGEPETSLYFIPNLYAHQPLRAGQRFLASLINRGIPKDFPKDKELRRTASIIRLTGPALLVGITTFFVAIFAL